MILTDKAKARLTFISASGYFIGTSLLLPGTLFFFPKFSDDYYDTGVRIYVLACSFLTLAAVADWIKVFFLPFKDTIVSLFMLLGGVLFLTASILYLSALGQTNAGTWVFRIGSFSYLGGSFSTLFFMYKPLFSKSNEYESDSFSSEEGKRILTKSKRDSFGGIQQIEEEVPKMKIINPGLIITLFFIIGAILFIIGGILSQLSLNGFAATWMFGSICFTSGAGISFFVQYPICCKRNKKPPEEEFEENIFGSQVSI